MIIGEYYHIYNRGAHKAPIFGDVSDYQRFVQLLYVANGEKAFSFRLLDPGKMFSYDFGEQLVQIVAYCLMPNHFHVALKEIRPSGTKKFIHKLSTSYSMYYNAKYRHSGTVFQGRYKAKGVTDIEYLQTLINYIHLNPFGLKEPNIIKDARKDFIDKAIEYSKEYEYSSFKDYLGIKRGQNVILNTKVGPM